MSGLVSVFIWLFALDGVLSVLHELVGCADGCATLFAARNWVAKITWLTSLLVFGAWILSPRVPGWIAVPPTVFLGWNMLGAMPLYLLWEPSTAGVVLCAAQCVFAVRLVLKLRGMTGGTLWLTDEHLPRRARSLWRVVGLCAATGVTLVAAVVLHAPLWMALGIDQWTDGFVAFDRQSVLVERRRFESGGQSIELVAMMHLGEDASYRAIFGSFTTPGTVVLTEGVTDRGGRLAGAFSYDQLAASLGLTAQPRVSRALNELSTTEADTDARVVSGWPHLQHADVDASAFSDETIAFLEHLGTLLRPRSTADLLMLIGTEIPPGVQDDLISLRNAHLIEQLDLALDRYDRVVIPWGALHLPAIQLAVQARGFELSAVSRLPIIRYRTLTAAIAAKLGW